MRIFTFGLLILFSTLGALGQKYEAEKFDAALLQAKYGAMLVYNGERNSFSIKFVAKSFKPTEAENFVRVDGNLINSTIVPFQVEVDFDKLEESIQKKLLTQWKKYEKDWIEKEHKTKLLKETEEFVRIGGRLFIYWSYDMPQDGNPDTVDKQLLLVTACFDQMLILSGPVEKNKSVTVLKDKLFAIAKTLEVNPRQVQDIKKLYTDLMK
ncbi:MAG TPA: hypothetical protein DGG95_05300 [Cytophagales bacterium]|jgi:hypothetical protein|nr:hypothetical protein [Cytophagales bacterium]